MSDITLNRFFALHVIALPLVLVMLVFVHIVALHHVGSNNPDGVEINEPNGIDPGEGQVNGHRRAQASRADDQDLGVQELPLPLATDLRHDDVSAVPLHLIRSQGFNFLGYGHK